MRLGTSSPLAYDSGEHWAKYQKEQGCSAVVFPVQSSDPEKKIIEYDPEMPVILEHLDTDEDYLKYLGYLKEELNGLYKTI